MKERLVTLLQLAGAALIALAAWIVNPAAGLATAGIGMIVFSLAWERA